MKKEELDSIVSEKNGIRTIRYGISIKPEDAKKEIKNKKKKFIEIYGISGQYFKVLHKEERKVVIIDSMEAFQEILKKFHIKGIETISTIRNVGEPAFYFSRIAITNDSIFRISKEISKEEFEKIESGLTNVSLDFKPEPIMTATNFVTTVDIPAVFCKAGTNPNISMEEMECLIAHQTKQQRLKLKMLSQK